MDVRRLEVLRELADRGSVTAVARALHLTPSAVSQQLKALEREAGMPLTERNGRGLALTAPGRMLAETARDVAVALARAEATWSEYTLEPVGEVTLSVFGTVGEMLLPGLLHRIDDLPGLELRCTDLDTAEGDWSTYTPDYDIVLADSPGVQPDWRDHGLTVIELLREQLDIAMPESHPLAGEVAVTPAQVVDEPWIGVPYGRPYDRILQRIEAITGRDAVVRQRINDNSIVEALVAAGHGIAILPRFTTRDRENGIVTRPLEGVRSERIIWALLRPDRLERPSVRLALEALQAEAAAFLSAHTAA